MVHFAPRAEPLHPVAVAALPEHAPALAARLRRLSDEQLQRLSGVRADGALVVLGSDLPWVDGALYLGAQGALLLPTWAEPAVHPQLLERALRRAHPKLPGGPLALLLPRLDAEPLVVPLASARPLSRENL